MRPHLPIKLHRIERAIANWMLTRSGPVLALPFVALACALEIVAYLFDLENDPGVHGIDGFLVDIPWWSLTLTVVSPDLRSEDSDEL